MGHLGRCNNSRGAPSRPRGGGRGRGKSLPRAGEGCALEERRKELVKPPAPRGLVGLMAVVEQPPSDFAPGRAATCARSRSKTVGARPMSSSPRVARGRNPVRPKTRAPGHHLNYLRDHLGVPSRAGKTFLSGGHAALGGSSIHPKILGHQRTVESGRGPQARLESRWPSALGS